MGTLRALQIVCLLGLSGCIPVGGGLDEYGGVPVAAQDFQGRTYHIFDKPASSKLMIAPTFGATAGDEFTRALTLDFGDNEVPDPAYRGAVESFLAGTGRKCKVEVGRLIVRPQWEFKYKCECQVGWSLGRCGGV